MKSKFHRINFRSFLHANGTSGTLSPRNVPVYPPLVLGAYLLANGGRRDDGCYWEIGRLHCLKFWHRYFHIVIPTGKGYLLPHKMERHHFYSLCWNNCIIPNHHHHSKPVPKSRFRQAVWLSQFMHGHLFTAFQCEMCGYFLQLPSYTTEGDSYWCGFLALGIAVALP